MSEKIEGAKTLLRLLRMLSKQYKHERWKYESLGLTEPIIVFYAFASACKWMQEDIASAFGKFSKEVLQ